MSQSVNLKILIVVFLAGLVSAWTTPSQATSCPLSTGIQLRFPPTVRNNTPSDWSPPPYGWIFGNWFVAYSSRLSYQKLYNFQADTYPAFPTGNLSANQRQNIDLTSWNIAKTGNATIDDHIYSVFGYDTPATAIAPAVYVFNGTGVLSSVGNSWEILAWGYDENGEGYRAEFETRVPNSDEPCINIVSRSETGPDEATMSEIVATMQQLFNGSEIGVYVANLTRIPNDGRRMGLGPVACDTACIDNMNLPP